MSQKYHVKSDGTVGVCKAERGRCPYQSAPHFNSEQEAQAHVNKQSEKEHGLLPGVDKGSFNEITNEYEKKSREREQAERKKQPKPKKKEKMKDNKELRAELEKVWADEKMVKHCLNSIRYIQIDEYFVSIGNRLPNISKTLWYDDEKDDPGKSWERFKSYNDSLHRPKLLKLYDKGRNLYFVINYHSLGEGEGKILAPTYLEENRANQPYVLREVTESELELINQDIKEIQEHYDKRLERYFKRYGDKIRSSGYWVNR